LVACLPDCIIPVGGADQRKQTLNWEHEKLAIYMSLPTTLVVGLSNAKKALEPALQMSVPESWNGTATIDSVKHIHCNNKGELKHYYLSNTEHLNRTTYCCCLDPELPD
jgi:hypothetical protein